MFLLLLLISAAGYPQSWQLSKEKDGIRLYSRTEPGKSVKSYRGETTVKAPAEKVFAMIEDVNHTDWWDENISGMKVVKYEKNKMARYYLIYDLPWPLTDRDLCVDVKVIIDNATGVRKVEAKPLPSLIPVNKDYVRITDYSQTWLVTPTGPSSCKVVLEGHADPAGSVPDWLTNMLIVDSPYKIMSEVKKRMEK